jgi:hypothetical protein
MKAMRVSFPILISAFLLFCCEDDPKDNVKNSVIDAVSNGTWRITNFNQNHADKTSQFEHYTFTFASGNFLVAETDTATYYGGWTISDTDANNDVLSDLRFNILEFAAPAPEDFHGLVNDWVIPEYSQTILKLIDVNNGGATDSLVFEKN